MFFWDQYWPDVLQHFPIFVALNDSTMKRFVLSICLLFTIACLYSQEHLEFRDIPIDGPLKSFVKKLKKQGYKQISNNGTYRTLEGKFAIGNAQISVYSTDKTKTVWKVSVVYGIYDTWNQVKKAYTDLKEMYISKYGMPSNVYELFAPGYTGYELKAIELEKGAYACFFDIPNGSISIVIDYRGAVLVTYEDAINGDLFSKEELDGI